MHNTPIKVLFYIPTLKGGGAEKVLINMVNNMDQSRFDVTVATEFYDLEHQKLAEGIHYKSIFGKAGGKSKKLLHLLYRVLCSLKLTYSLFLKNNYELEIAYLECGATKVIAYSTNKHAKKIAWVHCDLKQIYGISSNPGKTKKLYQKYDKVICVSEDVKKSYDDLFPDCTKATVYHNVIDDTEIRTKAKEACNIEKSNDIIDLLGVGRLIKIKRFDDMIKIAKMLSDSNIKYRLRIIGDGPEREYLEEIISRLGLSDCVKLLGYQPNPYKYIDKSDIILSTSVTEGLSTVVIESLILGKAIVVKQCSGMDELLLDSVGGIITDRSDDSFFQALKQMICDPQFRKKYESQAFELGKKYYARQTINDIEACFTEIIEVG